MRNHKRYLFFIVFLISISVITGLRSANAVITTETIVATQDTKIMQSNPTTNYGSDPQIKVWYNPPEHGLLFFNVSSIMNRNYTSAILRIELGMSSFTKLSLYIINESWDEMSVTWNTAPYYNTSLKCSRDLAVGSNTKFINITPLVANWTTGKVPNFGLYLKPDLNGISFYSRETAAAYRPKLLIDFEVEGDLNPIPSYEIGIVIMGLICVLFFSLISRKKVLYL